MERTLPFLSKKSFAGLLFLICFTFSGLNAQSDTLIIGYKDNVTYAQKAILPNLLNMQTLDSIPLFNQYKYVLPHMIDLNQIDISDSLRGVLINNFGHDVIFDAEEKKLVARASGKQKKAGAEGSDFNFELGLDLLDDYYSDCGDSQCIAGVISPITSQVCSLSVANNMVKVAVLDTGIDPLAANSLSYDLVLSPNSLPPASAPYDYHTSKHGTKVAEEILSASCCSANTELINIRFLDKWGKGYLWNLLKGIALAIDEEVCVINISAGFTDDSIIPSGIVRPLEKAMDIAGTYDILVVTSAGNAGENNDTIPHFPSNYSYMDHVVAVGANCDDSMESYSNFGDSLVTLTTDGDYSFMEKGTSFAAGVISGFAALLRINAPEGSLCDAVQLKQVMVDNVNTAFPIDTDAGGALMPYQTLLAWQMPPPVPLIGHNGDGSNEVAGTNLVPTIYPSPFEDDLTIELGLESDAIAEIVVTNLSGHLVTQSKKEGIKGSNVWKLDNLNLTASGVYLLQIRVNGEIFNQKIVRL